MEHRSTLIKICLVLFVICHDGKSALPNYDNNSNLKTTSHVVIGDNSTSLVTDEFFKEFWQGTNKGLCAAGQINHGSVCCLPVSCSLGQEIVACTVNGTEDKCKPCDTGYIQVSNVSSLNMLEAKCFLKKKQHNDCPIDDMKPSRNNLSYNFPLPCQCKNEDCYYENSLDNAGTCQRALHICGEQQEMNETGDCVACPWYAYKDIVGCQPCTQNDTLLRYGRTDGKYVPSASTVPTTTTSTEKVTGTDKQQTNLETVRTDTTRQQQPDHNNHTVIISIVISSVVGVLFLIVLAVLVVRRKPTCFGGRGRQPPQDIQNPLLTGSPPVTPIAGGTPIDGNTPQNGGLVNGLSSPFYQYNQNGLLQNGSPNINGQIGQGNGHLGQGNGHLGQGNGELGLSNGRTVNNNLPATDLHHLQQISTSDALYPVLHNGHQGKHPENLSLAATARKQASSNGMAEIKETPVKNKQPTTHVSIHGNTFEKCKIYLPFKRAPCEEVSGSFGMSSMESEADPGVAHGTTPTIVQAGRRDGYLIPGRVPGVVPTHNEKVADNCRPEYKQLDPTYLQEAPIQHPGGGRFGEDVRMMTLNKPNYSFDTNMEPTISEMGASTYIPEPGVPVSTPEPELGVSTSGPEMGVIKPGPDRTATVIGLPHPMRQIAKVAPMRQTDTTRLESVRHTSGHPSCRINESDESASGDNGTSITSYGVGQLQSDIANTSDFSTDTPTYQDASQRPPGPGTLRSDETTRLKQTVSDPPVARTNPVHPVQPVTPQGAHTDGQNEQVSDDNTREKLVAADETIAKHYEDDWSSLETDGVPDSYDSVSDLKKTLQHDDKDSKCTDTNTECPAHPDSVQISEMFDSEEQSVGQGNDKEVSGDIDRACDSQYSQSTERTSDGSEKESDFDQSVEIGAISDASLQQQKSDGGQSMVKNGISFQQENDRGQRVINRPELSGRSETVDESIEVDNPEVKTEVKTELNTKVNTEVNAQLPTMSGTSDGSFEIGGDVDINAIHAENQHTQEITCRGETFDEANSLHSGYKGFNPN